MQSYSLSVPDLSSIIHEWLEFESGLAAFTASSLKTCGKNSYIHFSLALV